jgi:putative ABC transport system substrate-binding protein
MRRRDFIGSLIGTAVAWPLVAGAQQPAMPVIGLLSSTVADADELAVIRRGLSEQGYVEGRNVRVEYRSADGHYDRLPTLATELVSMRVTVIAAIGSSPSAIAASGDLDNSDRVFRWGRSGRAWSGR